ncbi:MAG TPA: hypothetical protein PKY77_21345 [Phycisphaerae bacterium]|nr:hypothetical protein [Phycisphaerae bacterium]HRY69746.1 hypothetical protein [Phycisphaerae bacterium]HSA29386.1 hypothetical protein [Phycisphaerae bacterium]
MVRLCGAYLALFAFSITVLLGLSAGNPIEVILPRAIWALVLFCAIGLSAGWVGSRILDEHALRRSREMFTEVDESEAQHEPQAPGKDTGAAKTLVGQKRAEVRAGAGAAAPAGATSSARAPATAGGGPR